MYAVFQCENGNVKSAREPFCGHSDDEPSESMYWFDMELPTLYYWMVISNLEL